jgi:hypothetical protein
MLECGQLRGPFVVPMAQPIIFVRGASHNFQFAHSKIAFESFVNQNGV